MPRCCTQKGWVYLTQSAHVVTVRVEDLPVRDTEFSLGTGYSRCEETRRRRSARMLPLLKPGNLYLTHKLVWIYFIWIFQLDIGWLLGLFSPP